MIDIHTHLFWKSYDIDREAVIQRARQAGVEKMIVVGTTLEESKSALATAERYGLGATLGMHPHEFNEGGSAADGGFEFIEEFRELAKNATVIAIGECGLDYFSHNPDKTITQEEKERQRLGFLAQIVLASELQIPLIIHCRDAYEDMLSILKVEGSQLKAIILHCYMGNTEITEQFMKLPNLYFSFTGNITYPVKKHLAGTNDDLGETVKVIPLERVLTETDCPFLAPQKKRGERNEPAHVRYALEKIAELHGRSRKEVESVIQENYQKIFKH